MIEIVLQEEYCYQFMELFHSVSPFKIGIVFTECQTYNQKRK